MTDKLADAIKPCPLCAGDSGGAGRIVSRPATKNDEKVEGQDDRINDRKEF